MAIFRSVLTSVRRAVFLLFQAQVKVRVGDGMRVELARREAPRPAAVKAQGSTAPDPDELAAIRRELAELLDADPQARATWRHLAYIERALGHKGLRALKLVPLEVLQTALDQFESQVTNWEPRGLATLRSKMAVAVRERQTADAAEAAREQPVSAPGA